mmetsp:Transcript_6089/g.13498  ORF Transcript_6089/g.13498 Transcript_6089/m.13498 type:complete len:460 (-) Transcript_6089:58-1437(-)
MGCQASVAIDGAEPWKGVRTGFYEEYSLDMSRKLGEGSFGQVRVTFRKGSGQSRAVKVIDIRENESQSSSSALDKVDKKLAMEVKAEALLWQRIGTHKHCVTLLDTYVEQGFCFMVMERCVASLPDWVQDPRHNRGYLSMTEIIRQMLYGVQHVHKQGIVHRDVKPENFLMGTDGVKLCDFGLAAPLPMSGKLKGINGTAPYMSPEMLNGQLYDTKTDMWSFGVSVYTLFYGSVPFSAKERTSKAFREVIRQGAVQPSYVPEPRLPMPPPSAVALIQGLLSRSPGKRPSASLALDSPFFQAESEELSALPYAVKQTRSSRSSRRCPSSELHPDAPRRANSDATSLSGYDLVDTGVAVPDSPSEEMRARRISRQSTASFTPRTPIYTTKRVSTITTETCSTCTGTISDGAIIDLDVSTPTAAITRTRTASRTLSGLETLSRSGTGSLTFLDAEGHFITTL